MNTLGQRVSTLFALRSRFVPFWYQKVWPQYRPIVRINFVGLIMRCTSTVIIDCFTLVSNLLLLLEQAFEIELLYQLQSGCDIKLSSIFITSALIWDLYLDRQWKIVLSRIVFNFLNMKHILHFYTHLVLSNVYSKNINKSSSFWLRRYWGCLEIFRNHRKTM